MIDETELELRLRRIAEPPRPAVPGDVIRYVRELPTTHPRRHRWLRDRLSVLPGRAPRRSLALVPVALVLAAVLTGLVMQVRTSQQDPGGDGKPQWTGLEWRDVSSQFPEYALVPVQWAGGLATIAGRDGHLELSVDGASWSRVEGGPVGLQTLAAMPGGLVALDGAPGPCLSNVPAGTSCPYPAGVPWVSHDGRHWQRAAQMNPVQVPDRANDPFGVRFSFALLGDTTRAMLATRTDVYATTDGVAWRHGSLPAEMASAIQLSLRLDWPSGYLAEGLVESPDGSTKLSFGSDTGETYSVTGMQVEWQSADGITWSRAATSPDAWRTWTGSRGMVRAESGTLGPVTLQHSTDGVRWATDEGPNGAGVLEYGVGADGDRIVASSWGHGPEFWVSYGDGRWQRLAMTGDLSRAGGGPTFVTGNGVFLIGGHRVYFGRAVSGGSPRGTLLTPQPTPTVGPSQQPQISFGSDGTPAFPTGSPR